MPQFIDLTGMKFGKWTAVSYAPRAWNCVCDCGASRKLSSQALRTGHSKSCGCAKFEYISKSAQLRPRAKAIRAGLKRYIGKLCKVCQTNEKQVSSRTCWQCHLNYKKQRRNISAEVGREIETEIRRRWKVANPGRDAVKAAERRLNDGGKYRKYSRSYTALRNAGKIKATPSWAEIPAIASFYDACPEGHHVDHIIPLRGKNVCGLHVLGNLQYLPAAINIQKNNRFDEGMLAA